MESDTSSRSGIRSLTLWLRAPVTLTLPGWGVAAGAAGALALLLVALD